MSPEADIVDTVVGFARTLRAAGIDASPGRIQTMVESLAVVDSRSRSGVYWAGRLSVCASVDDVTRYDRVFESYFGGEAPHTRMRPVAPSRSTDLRPMSMEPLGGDTVEGDDAPPMLVADASSTERLRRRDFASMTVDERALVDRLLDRMRLPGETRRTRRHQRHHRGTLDQRRMLRDLLRNGGDPGRLRHRRRRARPRPVVVLVDISGSMSAYASALLRFAHAAGRRHATPTEVFTIGTRLTRVTDEIGHRDPDTAMAAISRAVPDWSGGTTLGARLAEFLDRWGQRGMARGAVVVILSDGWERDDVAELGQQMQRLSRLAHRVVWSNPRKGRDGFEPTAAGMAVALPHVDDFISGHSLAALEHLADVVAGVARAPFDP